MARTNHVKAFRGQKKCQFEKSNVSDGWSVKLCELSRVAHYRDGAETKLELDHPFTQTALRCEFCGKEIEVGMAYKFMVQKTGPRSSRKRDRHETCREWRPSEKTQSPVFMVLYGAEEAASDALGALVEPSLVEDTEDVREELMAILAQYAEGVSEAAELRLEAASNMEDGFGHPTEQSDQLQSDGEELESFQGEIEGTEVEEFDTANVDDDALEVWFDDQKAAVDEVIGALPL